jgi:hypothetical protein
MDGNVYARYNPANKVTDGDDGDVVIEYQNGEETVARSQIGLGNVDNPIVVKNMLAPQNHWHDVNDRAIHTRLHLALQDLAEILVVRDRQKKSSYYLICNLILL